MDKELASCTLMMIKQLVKLYMENRIDIFSLQENLKLKIQLLEYILSAGKTDELKEEISETLRKCNEIISGNFAGNKAL